MSLTIYGEADEQTIEQMNRCLGAEEGARGVLCADNHLGYSQPVGAAVAYREFISVSGVGYDIGCGNKAVSTDLTLADIEGEVPALMDTIVERVSFGMGRNSPEPIEHSVLDAVREADFEGQRDLADLAARQLGTVGSGNHYVDLFVADDERQTIWVGVHFGSRGFGHKTASGFLALAQDLPFAEAERKRLGLKIEGETVHADPVLLPIDSDLGQSYLSAMELAGRYAYAGRDVVVETVLGILGAQAVDEVHNHHNFAWREQHDGTDFWVVRKGCTPAFPGQRGFVGATMAETSVILQGTATAEDALFSTVHGAGRAMSRTEAKGRSRKRKFWACNDRDCDYSHTDKAQFACPDHPEATPLKRWREEQKAAGRVDWEAERANLMTLGVELRGAAADEAPPAYKRLDEVLTAQGDTIEVTRRLRPIGVAMAGPDIFDPFKD